jgi:hypothetical protein
MSYETDALVLVVSEETGAISIADNGSLQRFLSLDDLEHELSSRLGEVEGFSGFKRSKKSIWSGLWYAIRRGLIVAPLTVAVWYLADQATQVSADNVSVVLQPTSDPNHIVSVTAPQPVVFSVDFRGAKRSLDALLDTAEDGRVLLSWQAEQRTAGQFELQVATILSNHAQIRDLGLTVLEVIPPEVEVEVDRW